MKHPISNLKKAGMLLAFALLLISSKLFAGGGFVSVHVDGIWIVDGVQLNLTPNFQALPTVSSLPGDNIMRADLTWPSTHITDNPLNYNPVFQLENGVPAENRSSVATGNLDTPDDANPFLLANNRIFENDAYVQNMVAQDESPFNEGISSQTALRDHEVINLDEEEETDFEPAPTDESTQAQAGDESISEKALEAVGLHEAKLQVWPNPTAGRFFAKMDGLDGEAITYRILATDGKVIQLQAANDGENAFDLSHVAAGSYYLQAVSPSGKIWSSKLIVQH